MVELENGSIYVTFPAFPGIFCFTFVMLQAGITTFDSSPSKYGYIYKIIFCKHKSPIIAMWYQCESSKRVLVLRSSSLELLHWRIFFRTQPESQMIGSFVLVYRGTRVTDNNIFQVFNQNLVLVGCAKSLMGAHGNCNSLQLSQLSLKE